ncbi:MFS transporter [Rhodococcus antarcticus]|uniref:MFS transporter n=1 Tax=Rhodococcus antarcticus TaxID=2987751 RepID=A0ABY6P1W9_9NOCA|nr:MFS transporter [Rhodococcus antarcticus]UZJ25650.1 MFS transporter [Rhodococcus antarcticus]
MTAPTLGIDGPRAWAVTAAAFLAMFTVFGVAYGFAAFLAPISTELGSSRAATAAVFSLTTFLFFALGAVSGAAVDRVGPQKVLLVGALALGLGLVVTSRATSLWQAALGHGLGVGVGVACGYVPLVAVVGAWFDRRRTVAVGVAVSGIGAGTLVGAPVGAALIDAVGWRDAYLVLAAVAVAVLLGCAAVLRPAPVAFGSGPVPPLRPRLRTPAFRRLYGSQVLLTAVLFVPFVHLPAYAATTGAGTVAAAALVGVIGAASIVGRLALGGLADRLGVVRTYQGCFVAMAASYALWLGVPGYARLVVFAVVLGVGYGGFVALGPAVAAQTFGVQGLGGLLGVLYTSAAVGSALGPPVAGALIEARGFTVVAVLGLVIGAAAVGVVLMIRPPATSAPDDRTGQSSGAPASGPRATS